MPNLYGTALSPNALKTKESSRFGTRPLAFYTFYTDEANGLAANWQDSNSLYHQIVTALQRANVELYWLGQPYNANDVPFSIYGNDAFTFAIADDADTPQKYLEDTTTWTVLGANLDGYDNYIKLDGDFSLNRGQPVVFGMTDDGVLAGKTYYVYGWDNYNGATYVQLSETVTQTNNDGTPDYPQGVGHPGELFMLNPVPSTNPYSATFSFYDTYWSGTAGDVQFSCCWDPEFKVINAYNLDQIIGNTVSLQYGHSTLRAEVTAAGIWPLIGCCC
jgi:hypothetical protein